MRKFVAAVGIAIALVVTGAVASASADTAHLERIRPWRTL